ncbi:sensor histidine kinase [Amycolatopsis nigrescens]|uniref:sensor histidine kinase n=1 Tax=Amycolatopsis nigrescens TaxID=381445 RepID=UPI0003727B3D|nr:ATP-binding protein [Amycolatopsis nigrescens]
MASASETGHRSAGLWRGRFRGESVTGAVEREVHLLGRRAAAISRTAVIASAGVITLIAAWPGNAALVGAVVAINLWNAGYVIALRRGAGSWLILADTGMVAALCLTQAWTALSKDSLYAGTGWVLMVVSIVIVACQWHTGPRVGMAITGLLTLAYILGLVRADPTSWVGAVTNVWLVAEGALSRGLWSLVRRGSRTADQIIGERERARRDAAVAAARRADEREYLSALHDTAAATLLMVGTGVVDGSQPWLAEQATRDAAILREERDGAAEVDLVPLLAAAAARSRLEVASSLPPELVLPRAPGLALCGAVTEALTNVFRHSGCPAASMAVGSVAGCVHIEVVDEGRGFTPDAVPPDRRGVSLSIIERMHRAGGTATVTSRPGHGTRVRVEWSGG